MTASKTLKTIPPFASDGELEQFVDSADLSEYDLSGFKSVNFELRRKDARINMRLPAAQLTEIKSVAARQGIPYQRFIRNAIDRALASSKKAS